MARISIDYDLMYELARQVWHLRDDLDKSSKIERSFPPADIGPRERTAEALSDFYNDWRKSFGDAWNVLTDLGNLLDDIGKNFYDADAGIASSAAQQVSALQRQQARNDIAAYEQRMDAKRKQVQADEVRVRYAARERRLAQERAALAEKRAAAQKEQDALNRRQQELDTRNADLARKQEPLRRREEELRREQKELWSAQRAERDRQEAALASEQDAEDAKFRELEKEQEPLRRRQEELLDKQQALWREESETSKRQEAAFLAQQATLQREQDGYDARQKVLEKKQKDLWDERNALLRKKNVTQAELDAWDRKQDALTAEQDRLWKEEGEPLRKKWDDLRDEQQREQEAAQAPFRERQKELDAEQRAISDEQKPLEARQKALLEEQQALSKEHDARRAALQAEQDGQQDALDARRDALGDDFDRLKPESDELDARQRDLWDDQNAHDEAQKTLDAEDEALGRREGELQQAKAEALEEVSKQKPWTPDSGEPDPLYVRRGQDPDPENRPADAPTSFRHVDAQGTTTEITYRLDDKGEIKVGKDGQPVETTTTVTNKNGLRYEETTTKLAGDGDYRTVMRGSDGSVSKVVVDTDAHTAANPQGGSPVRYVVNEKDEILQVWQQKPGTDEWELTSSADEENDNLGHLPDHLRVESTIVDATGRPSDGTGYTEATKVFQPDESGRETSVTAYKAPDGAVTKVVTSTLGDNQTRYVTDTDGKVLEFWRRSVTYGDDGTTYVGPWEMTASRSIPEYAEQGWAFPELDADQKRKADEVTP
ncbi:hypothetical protein ACIQVC_38995 [Streptomyces sp. NPDC101112]|uniref:hypothetical protein n=1 Tax=Streptomyces sp. NPDC101112 TaxID=3366105 RepID=UPI0038194F50